MAAPSANSTLQGIKLPVPKVLISEKRIRRRISELARRISSDYKGTELTLVYVEKGALIFAADLVREIDLPLRVESMRASSYDGIKSSGNVRIRHLPDFELKGQNVLVVDDILDSGRTLSKISRRLKKLKPALVRTCVLLEKPSGLQTAFMADYVGFKIPDFFVYGYGLDYHGYCRNLPFVAYLKPGSK